MKKIRFEFVERKELGNGCINFIYKDAFDRKISFIETGTPWVYALDKDNTHVDFQNSAMLNRIVNAYVEMGVRQHDFEGGFYEAIKILKA